MYNKYVNNINIRPNTLILDWFSVPHKYYTLFIQYLSIS